MLLSPGESELKVFQNLYTQTRYFDEDGNAVDQGARSTWYTATATVRFGWRPRVNPSLEMTVRAVKDETRLPDFDGRSGLTAFTPRVQAVPWARLPWLTVASGLRIPVGSDLEGDSRDPFLDFADPIAIGQVLCDRDLNGSMRLYLEVGGWMRMAGDRSQFTTPVKAIWNFEPNRSWTLTFPTEVAVDWLGEASGGYSSQVGLGMKVRPGRAAELEALWTTFPLGRRAGAGQTFNLGVRFVR